MRRRGDAPTTTGLRIYTLSQTLIGFVASFAIGATEVAGPRIEAGEWEFNMKMDMPRMPANTPAMTYKSCMEQDNPVPPQAQPKNGKADCAVKQKMTGDTAEWTVRCSDGGPVGA